METGESNLLLSCILILLIFNACVNCDDSKTSKDYSRRSRSHIDSILNLLDKEKMTGSPEMILAKLKEINNKLVQPMAKAYKFYDMGHSQISDGALDAKPTVLFLGAYSGGKSTMINYLAGLEDDIKLEIGAEPTTTDFTVVYHGKNYRKVNGLVLTTDARQSFQNLEKYGEKFQERFSGREYPNKLLRKLTLVDTPGIIENHKQHMRGYPYNEVCEWFMDRADLIFVVFDPIKLDVGKEFESIFKRLEGRESKIRIILNKADSISTQDLIRVYGALCWNLAPLINVTEPARVYMGSFWDKTFRPNTYHDIFLSEEKLLLLDLNDAIVNQLHNKIALVRNHAKAIRLHAFLVDEYIKIFTTNRPYFFNLMRSKEDALQNLVNNPDKFGIFTRVLARSGISKYDLPDSNLYKNFFAINDIDSFKRMEQCGYFGSCLSKDLLDGIESAIDVQLPQLLSSLNESQENNVCTNEDASCSNKKENKSKHKKPKT